MSNESNNPMLANEAYRDDRAHVVHSWSVQSKLNPMVVNKARESISGTASGNNISTWLLNW